MTSDGRSKQPKLKVLIYTRYSSDLQNKRSNEDQELAGRRRAETEDWDVVGVMSDAAISGASGLHEAKRPGLSAMLARVAFGDIAFVVVDTSSRLARNQGDAHHIRDRLHYHGTQLYTLADGIIDAMKGAIRGLMDEQQRNELAHNIRRGQAGRVAEGRSPAGLAYGYDKANRLNEKGEFIRGLREINPDKACIVRRIFEGIGAGQSGRFVALELNREGIPGPRGGAWTSSVIIGSRARGDGVVRNRLYVGELVHNRTSKLVEPITRDIRIRPNGEHTWLVHPVPELQIVDRELWDKVQEQLELRGIAQPHTQRRPKRLLSGLGRCGVCGSGWILVRTEYWACGGVRAGKSCTNNRGITDACYHERVLTGLRDRLLEPEAIELYVKEYEAERVRRDRASGKRREVLERKLKTETTRIERLVDAIADGAGSFGDFKSKLEASKVERERLQQELDGIEHENVVLLHPSIAADYQRQVNMLHETLRASEADIDNEVVPQLRALIEGVIVTPARTGRGVALQVTGRLASMLELATGRAPTEAGMIMLERVKGIEPSS